MVEKRKSRSIPLMDYYEVLQLEYLSYYFRYFYYKRDVDKEKYLDFCQKKKHSIEKLALRNCFKSLFSDHETFYKYLDKFFNEKGMPDLCYRDGHQRKHLGYWDKFYLLNSESVLVRYKDKEYIVKASLCKFGEEGNDYIIIADENEVTQKVALEDVELIDKFFINNLYEGIFKAAE